MSKYIIEIAKEYEEYFKGILICGIADGKFAVDVIAREDLEELNSDYINEHFSDLQDTAYQKGLEEGNNIGYKNGVKDGQNKAWEAAKKIAEMWTRIGNEELLAVFGITERIGHSTIRSLFEKQTANEAIEKLKAHEQKQKADDEIKVGDEVYACMPNGKTQPFIIIKIYDEDGVKYYSGINADGNHVQGGLNYIKTGRHFPHVAELLKEMQS